MLDFYKITDVASENGTDIFHIELNPDCDVYKGHFPEQPVCPGVCSLNMIRECAERAAGKEMVMSGIKQCRMTSLLTPEQSNLKVQIEISKDNYPYTFNSVLSNGEKTFITMKGELSERVSFP